MRDARRNYVVVGIFVLAMLGALVGWLAVLSGRTGATEAYYTEYDNVMGLAEGAQILYQGYPVGQIEDIARARLEHGPGYRVEVSIRKGWEIPSDSVAVITQSGILSAVVIDIQAGRSTRMLEPGGRIPSQEGANFFTVLASVARDIGDLAETSLKPLLDTLTEGSSPLKDLAVDAPIIVDNLKRFTVEIHETSERLNTLLDRSGGRVETILTNLQTASKNVSSLSADLRHTRKRLDALLISTNNLVSENKDDIDHSFADLHHTLEVVASHVREISYNLEATTRNMNEFSAQIRRDPGVIIRGRGVAEDLAAGE